MSAPATSEVRYLIQGDGEVGTPVSEVEAASVSEMAAITYPRLVTDEELKATEITVAEQALVASDFCLGFATRGLHAVLAKEPYRTYPDGRKVPWLVHAYQQHRFHHDVKFARARKNRALAHYETTRRQLLDLTAGAGEVLWDRCQEV